MRPSAAAPASKKAAAAGRPADSAAAREALPAGRNAPAPPSAAPPAAPPPPAAAKGARRQVLSSQFKKTKMCVYHLQGLCHFEDACTFAHASRELQEAPDLRKTRLCKAFEAGSCEDPECEFAHGQTELRSTGLFYKRSLCTWHQRGKCRNGQQCRFAHGRDELRPGHLQAGQVAEPGGRRQGIGGKIPGQMPWLAETAEAVGGRQEWEEPMKVAVYAQTPVNELDGPYCADALTASGDLQAAYDIVEKGLKAKVDYLQRQVGELAWQCNFMRGRLATGNTPPGLRSDTVLWPALLERSIQDGGEGWFGGADLGQPGRFVVGT